MPAPLVGLAAGLVKGAVVAGRGAMVVGRGAMVVGRAGARGAGALARATARGAARGGASGARDFIKGRKKTVKPDAIKKKGGPEMGPEQEGALVVRPSSPLVESTSALAPIRPSPVPIAETGKKVGATLLEQIKNKVIDIDKVLKGMVSAKKEADVDEKQEKEDKGRDKKEKLLEKVDKKDKDKKISKLKVPGKGLFAGIFDFLKNILIGRLLVWFIQTQKGVPGGNILTGIANFAEGIIDTLIGVLDAVGGFLVYTNKKSKEAKEWLKENRGDEAVERYEGLLGGLTDLFNAFVIVGSAFAALGGLKGPGKGPGKKPDKPGKKPDKPGVKPKTKPLGKGKPGMKPTGPRGAARTMQMKHGHAARGIYENAIENGKSPRAAKAAVDKALKKGQIVSKPQTGSLGGTDKGSKIAKGGLKKIPKRLATKVLGKQGIMAMKGIAKGFSRIPILGPIVVAVSSLLAGEPPGQALFKGLGAALGGFLGTFIPIPILGTMLGEVMGTFVGDLLYSLILGGGTKEAGDKLMNAIKTALDVGGLIVKFVGDGFKNFINGFFEKDPIEIPDGGFRRSAATKIVEFLGMKDFLKDRGYVDGKDQVTKFPNLMNLINPFSVIGLLGQSFFGDISSTTDSSSAKAVEEDKEEGGGGLFGGLFGGGDKKQPELTGNDEGGAAIPDGDGQTAAGTSTKGMITGPAGYSRIGAGAAYHVDTKFHSSLGMSGMISAMDKMADAYAAKNKEIVFSGQGYARLKAYKSDLDPKEKKALLTSAIDAHSHSTFMRAEGFKPFDYYIPDTGIRDLYHPSTEKAEIILPDFGGKTNVGALYGGYGKSANIFDSSGKHVAMTGHGDLAYAEGGETLAIPHMALIGEKGKEFVIDADSYEPIEKMYPGLFDAINEATGEDAVAVLMEYTDYERPQQQPAMAGVGGGSAGETINNEPTSNTATTDGGIQMHRGGARARKFSFRYKHG